MAIFKFRGFDIFVAWNLSNLAPSKDLGRHTGRKGFKLLATRGVATCPRQLFLAQSWRFADLPQIYIWLMVEEKNPLKNMKVSWDDDYSQYMGK